MSFVGINTFFKYLGMWLERCKKVGNIVIKEREVGFCIVFNLFSSSKIIGSCVDHKNKMQ